MTDLKPLDGTAVVLHLVEAARKWAARHGRDLGNIFDTESANLAAWVGTLDDWVSTARPPVTAPEWTPRRWRELVAGDRVSVGGVEAEVESAMLVPWHVDPRGSDYRPVSLEHEVVAIRLMGRDQLYRMPPDGEVETLRGPAGQAIDEAAALGALSPDQVLGSWAGMAAETLAAAGLWHESTDPRE